MPPIALISDLGNEDYFVGAMKGVILSINPDAKIMDITHQVPKHDVRTASFILTNAAETFPEKSIFVAVIDPGVGTERECILLETKNELRFIGPDNGVFTLVAERFGVKEIRKISNKDLMKSEISSTFHGRDVMAPVGAHLSLGVKSSKVGPEIQDLKLLDIEKPEMEGDEINGQVINVDDFGNIVTNIEADLVKELGELGTVFKIKIGEQEFSAPFAQAFDEVQRGESLCYIGSSNSLEIGKNQGDLAAEIGAKRNNKVNIGINS